VRGYNISSLTSVCTVLHKQLLVWLRLVFLGGTAWLNSCLKLLTPRLSQVVTQHRSRDSSGYQAGLVLTVIASALWRPQKHHLSEAKTL
jgi:cbb3-type cytochrome oxidase subunit 3